MPGQQVPQRVHRWQDLHGCGLRLPARLESLPERDVLQRDVLPQRDVLQRDVLPQRDMCSGRGLLFQR